MSKGTVPKLSPITNPTIHRQRHQERPMTIVFPSQTDTTYFPDGCSSVTVTARYDDSQDESRSYCLTKAYYAHLQNDTEGGDQDDTDEIASVFIPLNASRHRYSGMSNKWQIYRRDGHGSGYMEEYTASKKDFREMHRQMWLEPAHLEHVLRLRDCSLLKQIGGTTYAKVKYQQHSVLQDLSPPEEGKESVKYILLMGHEWPSDIGSTQQFQGESYVYSSEVPDTEKSSVFKRFLTRINPTSHSTRRYVAPVDNEHNVFADEEHGKGGNGNPACAMSEDTCGVHLS